MWWVAGVVAVVLLTGCSAGLELESGRESVSRVTAEPTPIASPTTTPTATREPEPASEAPVAVVSAPGGAADCVTGLWAFAVDYVTPSGEMFAGRSASGVCFDEIESRAASGRLTLDNRRGTVEPGSVVLFMVPLFPIDADGRECSREFGFACKQR